jgi:hypothetical protein
MTAATLPFLASILIFLANPLLTNRALAQVKSWMAAMRPAGADTHAIPAYLAEEQILSYVEYATDLVQVIPAVTLTGVAIAVAAPGHFSPVATGAWIVGVVLVLIIADAIVLSVPPQRYLRRKFRGVSLVSAIGIALNLIAWLVVSFWT